MSNIVYYLFGLVDVEMMGDETQKGKEVAKKIFGACRATTGLAHRATNYVIWCNLEEGQQTIIRENVSSFDTAVVVKLDTYTNKITLIYPVKLYTADGSNTLQHTEIPGQNWCLRLCTDGQYYWNSKIGL